MLVLRNARDLERHAVALGRSPVEGLGGVLVPTMGALHDGHGALIRDGVQLARERGDAAGCTVSIFVNPTQFNDRADFDRYPRTEKEDLARCEGAGAAAVFAPDVETMYPPPPHPGVTVPPLPRVATEPGLEDAHRPGHFAGVCQVVMRLFRLLRPAAAVFGEKDWQQLRVISAMTEEAGLSLEIVPAPTVREPDGLAMSSRNRFLTPAERRQAASLSAALIRAGAETEPGRAEGVMRAVLAEAGLVPEYAVVRDARTLGPAGPAAARALIACRVGSVRLIDNAPWPMRKREDG